jgi:hypothetical protein
MCFWTSLLWEKLSGQSQGARSWLNNVILGGGPTHICDNFEHPRGHVLMGFFGPLIATYWPVDKQCTKMPKKMRSAPPSLEGLWPFIHSYI